LYKTGKVKVIFIIILSSEGLGVVPVPYPSRWSWSFHHFLGHTIFLLLLGHTAVPVYYPCA